MSIAPVHDRSRLGYGAVLRVPGMRAIFVAHAVSMSGSVAVEVALSILIYQRTGSALLSALVLVCSFVPYAVGGTFLSSITDRYPPRRVLVCCDLISAGAVAAMLLPGMPVGGLLALLVVIGTVAPVFGGARAASLSQLLEADIFPIGRSLLRAISQGTVLAGFALGSIAVAALGPTWLLVADVLSFLASATLLRFGTAATPACGAAESGSGALLRASLDGLRYIATTPRLRTIMLLSWAVPAFGSVADGLAVAYSTHVGAAATAAGALFTGYAAGTVVGEVVVARLSPAHRRALLVPLILASQLPLIAFLARPGIAIAAGLLVVAGAGFAFNQGLDPLILAATDPGYRGRLFTVQSSGLMTVQGLGIGAAGVAGSFLSPALVIGAAGMIGVAVTLGLVVRIR